MLKRKILCIVFIITIMCITTGSVFAQSNLFNTVEYTEQYKKWLQLSDEEKEGLLEPRKYDVPKTEEQYKNPLTYIRLLKSNGTDKYSLKNVIPENVVVKNQGGTSACWAFAALAQLETNLALNNYYQGRVAKKYDFSEKHMEYATSQTFYDGTNETGFFREVDDGGNFIISTAYLTNGTGAVSESSMPFDYKTEKISLEDIKIEEITQIYDTVFLPIYNVETDNIETIKTEMKKHIKDYGGIIANIHGAALNSDYCNISTGAIYCNDAEKCPIDHAVLIIGWNDGYEIENFNEAVQPQNKGAWIIKNSWGTGEEYTLEEMKQIIFSESNDYCIDKGYTEAALIPDIEAQEFFKELGFKINDEGKAVLKYGDDGIMYVSYEDVNVYNSLVGIEKASDKLNYENIYQYNELGQNIMLETQGIKQIYLKNKFTKKTEGKEFLKQVSIMAPEEYTCKVFVNENAEIGTLHHVPLKAGDTETIQAGYHTLEFADPIEITGKEFIVVVEVTGKRENVYYYMESKIDNTLFANVKVENNKCFIGQSLDNDESYEDMSKINVSLGLEGTINGADSTIKAFTTSNVKDTSLNRIEITNPPSKINYIEGEKFEKEGMVLTAYYNDGTSWEIFGYNIENGTNLVKNQESIIISYEGKKVQQPITVVENKVESIEIKTQPLKKEYVAGEDFDKTGMVVEAVYTDGTVETVENFEILDGEPLKNNQETVKISYKGKMIELSVTVAVNPVVLLTIKTLPIKTEYVVGQDFDKTGMVVEAKYENDLVRNVNNFEIENGTNLQEEQTAVTVKFDGQTTTQNIIVKVKTVESISMKQNPSKIEYKQYEEDLSLDDGKIEVLYNDGTTEIINLNSENVDVTGFDNKLAGEKTITVEYKGKTTNFKVQIKEKQQPENSNFLNAKGIITAIKINGSDEEDVIMEIDLNNISKNTVNEKYEYYYYLSANQKEDRIENWIKITQEQTDPNKISFTINTKDIKNYQELVNAEKLYLYVKEIAYIGADQKAFTTSGIELSYNMNVEQYLEELGKQEIKPEGEMPGKTEQQNPDDTTATGNLPNTGNKMVIMAILMISVLGIVGYKKYKKIELK